MPDSQLTPQMTSPSEMLDDLVKRHAVNKSELSRWIGVQYTTLNLWTKGHYFNAENQQRVLRALREAKRAGLLNIPYELPDNYFSVNAERAREALRTNRASVIEYFSTSTKIGRSMTPDERSRIEALDVAFELDVALCQALVMSMRGKLRGDPEAVASVQRKLKSHAASHKTKTPRRKG